MRKYAYLAFSLLVLATSCVNFGKSQRMIPANQAYSYPIDNQQYVVVAVEDNGVTASEAKAAARRQAAQVTLDNGYSYFTIVSEEKTEVVKTGQADQSQVPGNLYQELIAQKQFGRTTKDQSFSSETLPAIRLVIQCYAEKPVGKKSYDAAELLNQ